MTDYYNQPWQTKDNCVFALTPRGFNIFYAHVERGVECDDDMRQRIVKTIAAAPQMLAALKAIERAESPNNVQSWDMAMEQVRAAIKAAEA